MRIYTGGTFDMFHSGHVNFLRQCALLGDVIVSLNTDWFIEHYKGRKPIMSYDERRQCLLGCKYVSDVIENGGNSDSKIAILKVKPNVVAIGTDWAVKDYYSQMNFTQKWLDDHNIVLVYIPYTPGISTTDLKARICQSV